jgi:hypothetical protein
MANRNAPAHGVMEGEGAYNQHGKLPLEGAALALPLLEKAVRDLKVECGEEAIVVADYGSSQGKNSLVPILLAIRCLRKRLGPARPISVVHIDQPSNDFNSLFEVLTSDPDRYVDLEPNIYAAAIGRSFYEKVLPSNSVHLGWCCYAAQWLSRTPASIPDHLISIRSTDGVRAEFERQAALDWEKFLELRARELRPGGRLLVVLPAMADDGQAGGIVSLFDLAYSVLAEMVADGVITDEERSRMALAVHPRRQRELLAPFADRDEFHGLGVEDLFLFEVADSAWAEYERDRDKEALASRRAAFFRTIFAPSLGCALASARKNGQAVVRFSRQLEQRLKRRLRTKPAAMNSFVAIILLAKSE